MDDSNSHVNLSYDKKRRLVVLKCFVGDVLRYTVLLNDQQADDLLIALDAIRDER